MRKLAIVRWDFIESKQIYFILRDQRMPEPRLRMVLICASGSRHCSGCCWMEAIHTIKRSNLVGTRILNSWISNSALRLYWIESNVFYSKKPTHAWTKIANDSYAQTCLVLIQAIDVTRPKPFILFKESERRENYCASVHIYSSQFEVFYSTSACISDQNHTQNLFKM